MTAWEALALSFVGLLSGFVNTLAGGGSLLTLPALMLLGLPADVANGTNRLSVFAQSATGLWSFHQQGRLPKDSLGGVFLLAGSGTLVGAVIASQVRPEQLEGVLLWMLAAMAVVLTVAPAAAVAAPGEAPRALRASPSGALGLFLAGVYGGFIQAGVGFVLLWVLGGALRMDLVRANAVKAFCTLVFGLLSLAVFVAAGQVAWGPAAALAVGTVFGARLGVRMAVRAPASLRWWLLAAVWVSCAAAWAREG